MAGTVFRLLVIFLGISHLICLNNAIPITSTLASNSYPSFLLLILLLIFLWYLPLYLQELED